MFTSFLITEGQTDIMITIPLVAEGKNTHESQLHIG